MKPTATEFLGEITSRVTHEFNNVLNSIGLQLALFEQRGLTPRACPELAAIRRMSTGAAAMIKQLQQLLGRQHAPLQALDLNAVVQQAVHAWQQENAAPPVRLELAPSPLPVLGTVVDLTRLIHLLLSSAAAALAGRTGTIMVRTRAMPHQVELRVEDPGPGIASEMLPRLFEPFAVTRAGGAGWEMTVCKALTGRLQGTCRGENRDEGGMAFMVELQPAPA